MSDTAEVLNEIRMMDDQTSLSKIYLEYLEKTKARIKKVKSKGGEDCDEKIAHALGEARDVVLDVSRKISSQKLRSGMLDAYRNLGREVGIRVFPILLEPYDPNQVAPFSESDRKRLEGSVQILFSVIEQLSRERADSRFTVSDVTRRAPGESVFVRPFLEDLRERAVVAADRMDALSLFRKEPLFMKIDHNSLRDQGATNRRRNSFVKKIAKGIADRISEAGISLDPAYVMQNIGEEGLYPERIRSG